MPRGITAAIVLRGGGVSYPEFVVPSDPLIAWGEANSDLSISGQKQAVPSLSFFIVFVFTTESNTFFKLYC